MPFSNSKHHFLRWGIICLIVFLLSAFLVVNNIYDCRDRWDVLFGIGSPKAAQYASFSEFLFDEPSFWIKLSVALFAFILASVLCILAIRQRVKANESERRRLADKFWKP